MWWHQDVAQSIDQGCNSWIGHFESVMLYLRHCPSSARLGTFQRFRAFAISSNARRLSGARANS